MYFRGQFRFPGCGRTGIFFPEWRKVHNLFMIAEHFPGMLHVER
ncbi:hypothetical protein HMPREF1545_04252 [Oscillibacter sp. KLE 1728]|nr:hypothetical protein HMPREF1545_04252 [Oscillibacter sp. KLE 1728]